MTKLICCVSIAAMGFLQIACATGKPHRELASMGAEVNIEKSGKNKAILITEPKKVSSGKRSIYEVNFKATRIEDPSFSTVTAYCEGTSERIISGGCAATYEGAFVSGSYAIYSSEQKSLNTYGIPGRELPADASGWACTFGNLRPGYGVMAQAICESTGR
jgi:hypothetical protein